MICADTLGTLARTVGEETFRPLAQDCVTAGMVRHQQDVDTLPCMWQEKWISTSYIGLTPYLKMADGKSPKYQSSYLI